jgi:hypothetical protein
VHARDAPVLAGLWLKNQTRPAPPRPAPTHPTLPQPNPHPIPQVANGIVDVALNILILAANLVLPKRPALARNARFVRVRSCCHAPAGLPLPIASSVPASLSICRTPLATFENP